ncbi:MAG TPA: FmdB family zinc ribbon protein [Acidimicrobiales bacterium]|nr:FmdB family zinc ribbon protein [Acidimicrobiales bacterium]
MPTYEYACKDCGEHLEVVQSFKDDALTVCPACGGNLRKVFGSVGIVFKGSGFYKTDNRSGKSASLNGSSSDKSDKSESTKTETTSSSSSSSKDSGSSSSTSSNGSSTTSTSSGSSSDSKPKAAVS